jgi:hypothetical protein
MLTLSLLGGVDDTSGTPYAHDYIKHFNSHTTPVDTYGNSPLLDTSYGGTDLTSGTWSAEQKNGWTVLEFTRGARVLGVSDKAHTLLTHFFMRNPAMSATDNYADTATSNYSTTYQRVAWAYDSLDISVANNVPEHVAHGLINIDFQLGGAVVPDVPSY